MAMSADNHLKRDMEAMKTTLELSDHPMRELKGRMSVPHTPQVALRPRVSMWMKLS